MHIMEGYLPPAHAIFWHAASLPFLGWGIWKLSKTLKENPESRLLLGACGGYAFVLSSLKLPSLNGSCSHPTGIGLGAVIFGPPAMIVTGFAVLFFQAALLAHGGFTTLGANMFSMAIAGSFISYGVFHAGKKLALPINLAVFLAAFAGDLGTYVVTSLQLALAFPDSQGGYAGAMLKFLSVFAITQLPLALSEGFLTVLVMNMLRKFAPDEILKLNSALKGKSK